MRGSTSTRLLLLCLSCLSLLFVLLIGPVNAQVDVIKIPSDLSPDHNPCYRLALSDIGNSLRGWGAMAAIIAVLLGSAAGLVYANYQNNEWNKVEFEKVSYTNLKFKRSSADMFHHVCMFLEYIQIIAVITCASYAFNYWGTGKDEDTVLLFNRYRQSDMPQTAGHILKSIIMLFLLQFDEIGWWSEPASSFNIFFENTVYTCVAFAVLFCLMVLIIYTESEASCLTSSSGRSMVQWMTFLCPAIGDVMFIPIVYNLLSVFSCMKTYRLPIIMNDFQPFMARDCTMECWSGNHIKLTVVAAITLAVYVPTAIYTRPIWQVLHDSLTIKSQPKYVIFMSYWKLMLCITHAFFQQFPGIHCFLIIALMAIALFITVQWTPTTLPLFDLLLMVLHAILFWISVSVVVGLFLKGMVTFLILAGGSGLILIEYWYLSNYDLGGEDGRYAKGSVEWKRRQSLKKLEEKAAKKTRRSKLKNVASYDNAAYNSETGRDLPPLSDIEDLPDDPELRLMKINSGSLQGLVFRDKETGKEVRVLGVKNKHIAPGIKTGNLKVLGLKLDTPIPTQTPVSFHIRDKDNGTLVIMRSPDSSLYKYLQLKLNGYIAYFNAHFVVNIKDRPKVAKREKGALVKKPYLTAAEGPSHDLFDRRVVDDDSHIKRYQPVNNNNLMAIVQNTGPDLESFQYNIVHHAKSLNEWIYKHHATPSVLGSQICKVFNVKPYTQKKKVYVYNKQTQVVDRKIKEIEALLQNLRETADQRIRVAREQGYARGKDEARRKRFADGK